MILGINGIRLVVDRSGVARCIEALLNQLDELEHPFTDIRVYTPAAALPLRIPPRLRRPPTAKPLDKGGREVETVAPRPGRVA